MVIHHLSLLKTSLLSYMYNQQNAEHNIVIIIIIITIRIPTSKSSIINLPPMAQVVQERLSLRQLLLRDADPVRGADQRGLGRVSSLLH